MDPYLEAPTLWPGVHTALASMIRELLVPQLRPTYFVDIERRVYVLSEDDPARRIIVPDLSLLSSPSSRSSRSRPSSKAKPAVLVMLQEAVEVSEPLLVVRAV